MATQKHEIRMKRAYDETAAEDGTRVLVERLWPRGLSKERAKIDVWLKDVAPSAELRKWYGHDPEKFAEFRTRYEAELREEPARGALEELRGMAAKGPVTLIFATHDVEHSGAEVLHEVLTRKG
jgi:uncharacterized protein YeaO (DUF488 family)